ncbi:MAG: hypothetical protein K5657_04645 [Desulfovibrio sp.]|nr:hypothetical protein [Desulfovibrio sp.]
MEICLADFGTEPIILTLRDGVVLINDEVQPIKYVTEEELIAFNEKIKAIPESDDLGHEALRNAQRTQFVVSLLGRAVGEECVSYLTSILNQLHSRVIAYLEDDDECDCGCHGDQHRHTGDHNA